MKKHLIAFLSIIIFSLFMQACTSGKQALERGDYDAAVIKAVNRLRKNPNQKKAKETLKEAYPLAHNWHLDNISRARQSTNLFKWEQVADEYSALNRLYNEIEQCPACKRTVVATDYSHERDQARLTAAKVRYEEGMKHLEKGRTGNRIEARQAYDDLVMCNNLSPQYEDVIERIDEAKYYATLKVIVERIPMHSRLFKISNEFFENKINEYLHSMSGNPFVRFYTPEEAQATGMNEPDQIIYMEFDDFMVGAVSKNTKEIQTSKDSVVVGQTEVMEEKISYDTSGTKIITRTPVKKDVLGTVKAKYKVTTISIESRGLLDFKIVDAYTNRVLTQEKFPGTYVWSTQWGTFNGDERALSNDQLNVTKRQMLTPDLYPNAQELFVEFTLPIFDQISLKMRDFYRNY